MALVAILLLLPFAAHAQGESRMQEYLLSVNRLYAALEYEQALGQVARAKRFARTVEEDVILSLYEGIILADMNRWEESSAAFKAALFLNPEAALPVEVSPKVERHVENVRQEVRREIAKAKPPKLPTKPQSPPQETANLPAGGLQPGPREAPSTEASKQEVVARTPPSGEALPVEVTKTAARRSIRPHVLIPAVGGSVLMIAGGTSWMLSRRELSRLRGNDESLVTREDVRRSASRGRTYQAIGVGLLGAGLVGVGVSTGLFLGTSANETSLSMSMNGTSVFVSGSWP